MKNLVFTSLILLSTAAFAEDVPSVGTIVKECNSAYGAIKITNNSKNGFDISFNGQTAEAKYVESSIKDDLINSEPTRGNIGEALVYFAMIIGDINFILKDIPPPKPTPEEIEEMKKDPIYLNAQLSFDLKKAKSVHSYEMVDPNAGSNPIGTFALAEAYDKDKNYLGSFISGLIVAECK